MDCLQNAKSSTIFEDFVVRGQGLEVRGQGLVNWSLRIWTLLEDKNSVVQVGFVQVHLAMESPYKMHFENAFNPLLHALFYYKASN